MLIRIFLILAILAGLGGIVATQFYVRPHIQTIVDDRDLYNRNWRSEQSRANKLDRDLKETENELVATEQELKTTQETLTGETARANAAEQLAGQLQEDLNDSENKLTRANQQLEAWRLLSVSIEEVKQIIQSEKDLQAMKAVLEQENVVLTRIAKDLREKLDAIVDREKIDPPLPPGTKGVVLVVDPKWNFVVLDLGSNKGMERRGVLMVSRNGKLVAKVRIMSVYADRCIANVMPGWDFGEILEGDRVIY